MRESIFFSSNAAGKGNVRREKSSSLGMLGTQIGIFEQVSYGGFTGFLKSKQS